MIKGLAITPPVLGRISIGRVIEKDGKRLPEKDDQFTITSQVQSKGAWLNHPLDEVLRADAPNGKLRSIPVQTLFNEPDLNFRAEYSLFDRTTGRLVCVGNGESCRRHTAEGLQYLPCPSPQFCELGKRGQCKPYGRLNVRISDDDELGTFIFRTTGYNSIRTLTARLRYLQAVSGDLLACLPLQLKLRSKSTTQSFRKAIYYADLTIREGLTLAEALEQAQVLHTQRQQAGFNQLALDAAARQGYGNGSFEDDEEEGTSVLEEFFHDSEVQNHDESLQSRPEVSSAVPKAINPLVQKLKLSEPSYL